MSFSTKPKNWGNILAIYIHNIFPSKFKSLRPSTKTVTTTQTSLGTYWAHPTCPQ
eukprot:Pgem_evm1s3495